ncbi:hypothetical protein N2605_25830 [Bradyrhizobium yuanmingense]|uniref:hypothetical protein n=1 Tax=Bradyrhizobium yuanmingense TaxID=108015 RepID=UPI0021A47921|nr:hypothetical protein [Bradyrhizobium sp. CB1024]UWU82980.1 hypothetical protein N2605_25830 [Bradyrhizobium sp. CB1024]
METSIRARRIDCDPSEEHILRRLGGALIVHWDSLSELQRGVLLSHASLMGDRENATQLMMQIRGFIDAHKEV